MAMAVSAEDVPGQCGVTMTEAQKNQCKVKTVLSTFDVKKNVQNDFPNYAPSICNPETHACKLADDGCSYSCIWQDECKV